SSPALMAELPASSAMVCVGPPLFANPAGSSSGFVLQNEVPVVLAQLAPVKPHVVPSSMLCPPSVMVTPTSTLQLPPEGLLATVLLIIVTVATPPETIPLQTAPPPTGLPTALLPTAPPPPAAPMLPEKVLSVTVSVPPLMMATSDPPLLPEKVQLVTVIVLTLLVMTPPLTALLPEKVQLVTVTVPVAPAAMMP